MILTVPSQLHLSLPKLHTSLNQLVLLTHFLPLVTVLLGMTARLWGLSAGLYNHCRAVWLREFPGKRPWRVLDAGSMMKEEDEEANEEVSTTRVSTVAARPIVSTTSSSISRTPTPAPNLPSPPPRPEIIPSSEHGEVIQRQQIPSSSSLALGTLIPRQPILPPSHLQEEPITYADSDSDSEPEPSPPPPTKPKPVPVVALPPPASPPPPPPKPSSVLSKPLKRPNPTSAISIGSPSLAKRPKVDPSLTALPAKERKVDAPTTKEGTKMVGTVKKVVKKKKVRRDEMDDIFG